MIFLEGDFVDKRYKIIRYFDKGGMSEVYEGFDTKTKKKVALKVLKKMDGHDHQINFKRLNSEIEVMSKISHPNIVEIIDYFLTKPYVIVLEYVKGKSLKDIIKKKAPLSIKEVIAIMNQALDAMVEVERNDVIHRDLKPQNIIITSSGLLKLLDFGISTRFTETLAAKEKSIVGSVKYMSPEVVESKQVTNQSDIYSMGIILYEMLTGTVPFSAANSMDTAIMHVTKTVPSIKLLSNDFHNDLDYIVRKATAKNTNERYQSFVEFRTDFNNFADLVSKSSDLGAWNKNTIIKKRGGFFKWLFGKSK